MRNLLFNVLFFSSTLATALLAIVISVGSGPERARWALRRHSRWIVWLTRNLLGASIEIRGLDRFKDGARPMLIVSKHQSELDPFPILAMYPDLSAIAMEELTNYPLIGPVIRKLGYILVSVEGKRRNQLRQVIEGSKRVASEGRPILIYPEGELMRIGSRQRYKSGVFYIYQATGQAATPVALSCGLVWPQRKWAKNPNRSCVIEFMEPIQPGLDQETFMALIEERIESGTMALLREHGTREEIALAEARRAKGLTNDDEVTVESLERKRGPGADDKMDADLSTDLTADVEAKG